MTTFCRTGAEEWRRVVRHDTAGLDVEPQPMTFREVWPAGIQAARPHSPDESVRLRWEDLLVPLPDLPGPAWAYALTYRVHQVEARSERIFFFEKRGPAEGTWIPIRHRTALDYEAEVALLLHRSEPERFGFLLANDLTDRAIQVHTFDRRQPAPGFTAAKSFPGALRIGPLLVVGGAQLWTDLEVRLIVNGELRQHLQARDCLMSPREFHRDIFASATTGDWGLALTGTTGGTIFRSPTPRERLDLLGRNVFSIKRARDAWLKQFKFLRVGDQLEIQSEILGTSQATIVAGAE